MSEYITIFDPIPWREVGISALQAFIIYWVVILGLKLVGRRVFGELGPQDFIVLLLVSEAANLGLTHQDAGFWGTLAGVLTIMFTGAMIERCHPLKQLIEDSKVVIVENGKPIPEKMKQNMVDDQDLENAARKYGMGHIEAFENMVLESDGSITGVLKPEFRPAHRIEAER